MRHHDFTVRIDRNFPLSTTEITELEDVIAYAITENFGFDCAVDHRADFTVIDREDEDAL